MARTKRLPLRMIRCPDALTEVVTAATLTDHADIAHSKGQLALPLLLQEGGQFSDECRKEIANEGMVLHHAARVAGAAVPFRHGGPRSGGAMAW